MEREKDRISCPAFMFLNKDFPSLETADFLLESNEANVVAG